MISDHATCADIFLMSRKEAQSSNPEGLPTVPGSGALLIASLILSWLASIEIIVAIGWALRLEALNSAPIIAFFAVTCIAIPLVRANPYSRKVVIRAGISSIAICIMTLAIGALVHDFSYDGQSYHQQGILALRHGWNPFLNYEYVGNNAMWVSHYAKGPWIVAASLMGLAGSVELGKAVNLMLAICAGLVAYAVICSNSGASKRFAIFVGVLIAANPVSDVQLLTYYVDGQVASVLAMVGLLSYLVAKGKNAVALVALVASVVIGINTKFSVAPFVILICGPLAMFLLVARRWRSFYSLAMAMVGALCLAFLVGFNPYATNYLTHGNPFYPLAGTTAIDIVSTNVTDQFLHRPRIEKFVLSMLSVSHSTVAEELISPSDQIRLKPPFVVRASELKTFYKSTDVRIGGFGPLMSAALLLVVIYGGLRAVAHSRDQTSCNRDWLAVCLVAGILVSGLAFPESWWARYAPQFWAAVVLAPSLLLLAKQQKASFLIGLSALGVLAVDTFVILTLAITHRVVQEFDYQAQVASLREISAVLPIAVDIVEDSTRYRLTQEGVKLVEELPATCPHMDRITGTDSRICIDDSVYARYLRGSPFIARTLGRTL